MYVYTHICRHGLLPKVAAWDVMLSALQGLKAVEVLGRFYVVVGAITCEKGWGVPYFCYIWEYKGITKNVFTHCDPNIDSR